MPEFLTSAPLLTVALVVILILLVAFVATRYRVANANEALVVSGARGASVRDERGQELRATGDKGIKVVVGGGTFVMPLLNRVGKLKLTARQINVQLTDAVTSQGIKVQVQGVATFKIGRDVESLRNAAERFLDTPDQQVDSIVKNVLEGSLRSILGTLTIEELIRDRQKLLQQVQDAARGDLATSGLLIDAFNIQSFSDESNYVDLLGQQNLATVERDARMAKATADQQAAVREAEAQQIKINAQRDVQLKQADVLTQVAAAQARADQAGPLAQAEATQEVVRKQTELAQLEADRKEKELLSATVKPAAADAQAAIERAEGQKRATIAAAEAQAEQVRLQGGAEAMVVLTKGEAEAKALAMRADAYKQFNDAALIQTVLAALPEIVKAAAEPLSRIDSLTVLSSEGASDVVRTATRTVAESAAVIRGLTGLDVPGLIGGAMGRTVSPPPSAAPATDGHPTPSEVVSPAGSETAVPADFPEAPGTPPRPSAVRSALAKAGAVAGTSPAAAAIGAAAKEVQDDDATLQQWAKWLAGELRGVPSIAQFNNLTLADLAARGPKPAQALWRTAEDALLDRYGKVTVGELLQRFPDATPHQ